MLMKLERFLMPKVAESLLGTGGLLYGLVGRNLHCFDGHIIEMARLDKDRLGLGHRVLVFGIDNGVESLDVK